MGSYLPSFFDISIFCLVVLGMDPRVLAHAKHPSTELQLALVLSFIMWLLDFSFLCLLGFNKTLVIFKCKKQ